MFTVPEDGALAVVEYEVTERISSIKLANMASLVARSVSGRLSVV